MSDPRLPDFLTTTSLTPPPDTTGTGPVSRLIRAVSRYLNAPARLTDAGFLGLALPRVRVGLRTMVLATLVAGGLLGMAARSAERRSRFLALASYHQGKVVWVRRGFTGSVIPGDHRHREIIFDSRGTVYATMEEARAALAPFEAENRRRAALADEYRAAAAAIWLPFAFSPPEP